MSTRVQTIYDLIKTRTAAVLGVEWSEMRKIFDPSQNDIRMAEKSYGVLPGEAPNFASAQQVFVFDHAFQVILSRRAVNRDDDSEILDITMDLYSKGDDILRDLCILKSLASANVIDVDTPSMQAPEVLENGAVILRLGFIVKHWLDRVVV